ncbi:MAG: hypothetical protein STHCBS139747_006972 [Sporothrix thermara]
MDDKIDYRALYEEEARRRRQEEQRRIDAERLLQQEKDARRDADNARRDADNALRDADNALRDAQKQLAKTTFPDFLNICHREVFAKLDVEKNTLLCTTGGLTRVDGKLYPRRLQLWQDFPARHEASFAALEEAFQQQPPLLPSPAGLDYLASKLSDKKLASEEDLKNFECLAVEGCALDVLPRYLELIHSGVAAIPNVDDAPSAISFNNYPYGVIATASDELDRPAYIAALGVAKRDMDAAIARAAAEEEERDRSGPLRKRQSPERTKVFPDQWCFRHSNNDTTRPLFVIEYKAAHKINKGLLRRCLKPETASSLMEDTIRALARTTADNDPDEETDRETPKDDDRVAKRDIAKVFVQIFHYMVDYGLQYSYATTGEALIFLYLDPAEPTTLYYHMEEPKQTVLSADREDMKHSAVALVTAFVLMAMTGQYMSQRWKKTLHKEQPRWPAPYDGMDAPTGNNAARLETVVTLAPRKENETADSRGDPRKQDSNRRRDQDDEDDSGPGSTAGLGGNAQASASSTRPTTGSTRTTQPSSGSTKSGSTATRGSRQKPESAPIWSVPVNAPLSPSLEYCTQACLLGLKTGGPKDPGCPNILLHQRHGDGDDNNRHPISAEEFRQLLVQQLADDMDHDIHSLERFGMYGAIGALFKIAVSAYGYCLVGKGVQKPHCKFLAAEETAYSFLEACQGRLVPVNLGIIELVDEYWTECGAHISHMMLLSFAGESLWHHVRRTKNANIYHDEMLKTVRELELHGITHGDINTKNMAWNEELQRVMAIDLDHAEIDEAVLVSAQQNKEQQSEQKQKPENGLFKRRDAADFSPQQAKRAKLDVF